MRVEEDIAFLLDELKSIRAQEQETISKLRYMLEMLYSLEVKIKELEDKRS